MLSPMPYAWSMVTAQLSFIYQHLKRRAVTASLSFHPIVCTTDIELQF